MAEPITRVTLTNARVILGELVKRAARGEVVIITDRCKDRIRLEAIAERRKSPKDIPYDLRRQIKVGAPYRVIPNDDRFEVVNCDTIGSGFFGSENAAQAEANRLNKIARE